LRSRKSRQPEYMKALVGVLILINVLFLSALLYVNWEILTIRKVEITKPQNISKAFKPPVNYVETQISGVNFTQASGVLELSCGAKSLQIFIDPQQATSIYNAINNITPSRPNTHDLISNILSSSSIVVEGVTIDKLINGTYYATIYLSKDGFLINVDSRPSDAIAIAIRVGCKIYINRELCNLTMSF